MKLRQKYEGRRKALYGDSAFLDIVCHKEYIDEFVAELLEGDVSFAMSSKLGIPRDYDGVIHTIELDTTGILDPNRESCVEYGDLEETQDVVDRFIERAIERGIDVTITAGESVCQNDDHNFKIELGGYDPFPWKGSN